jgi:LemA protein
MAIGIGGWVFLAVVALLGVATVVIYNGLVALRNRYRNAFAQIDVQLKRRYDLIPNLVETAKGYMAHERQTLEAVVTARQAAVRAEQRAATQPGSPQAMTGLAAAEAGLSGALMRLFAVAEAYPELKANETMMAVQEELTSTENRVAFARQGYNDSVMEYNTRRESIPANLIAGLFRFETAALLEATASAEERSAPPVSFR